MRRLSLIGIDALWQLSLGCLLMRTIAIFLRFTGNLNLSGTDGGGVKQYRAMATCQVFILIRIYVVCLFCCFTSQNNSYVHGGTVSSSNHTFFLGRLEQAVNQQFVHILSLVSDKQPFLNESVEGRRMTVDNLHESMGPDREYTL